MYTEPFRGCDTGADIAPGRPLVEEAGGPALGGRCAESAEQDPSRLSAMVIFGRQNPKVDLPRILST